MESLQANSEKFLKLVTDTQASKQKIYGESWIQRGPAIAFCNLNRKLDRLEFMARENQYDLFKALAVEEAAWDAFLDAAVYLQLHLRHVTFDVLKKNASKADKYGEPWSLTGGIGAYADVSRKVDALKIYAASIGLNLYENLVLSDVAVELTSDLYGYMILAGGYYLRSKQSTEKTPDSGTQEVGEENLIRQEAAPARPIGEAP